MAFTPTDEQAEVIQAILDGVDFSAIAYAGAGKTATIVEALNRMPRTTKALLIYFNAAARKEAETRLAHLPNVKVATNHTYAYAAVASKYPRGRVGQRISSKRIAELMHVPQAELSTGPLSAESVAAIASATIHKFTQGSDRELSTYHVPFTSLRNFDPSDYDAVRSAALETALLMWADKQDSRNGSLPLAHDDYLKMWALGKSSWFFGRDLLIMDEGQDANELMMSVFLKHNRAQRGMIGDPYQKLYGFRGTVDGLALLIEKLNAVKLHMTRTHRFGGAVVDAANVWLTLLGAELPLVGNPDMTSELVDDMPEPDAILNRTNAGCISSAIRMIDLDRTFSIGGGTEAIKDLADAAESLTQGKPTSHPDLIGFRSWPEVVKFATEDPNGSDLQVLVKLVDTHGASELKRIAELAKPTGEAQTHISTVHKVKGLEWPNVQLGDDFTGPDETKGQTEPNPDQMMTCYVGTTRAQRVLCEGSASWGREWLAEHGSDYPSFD